MAITSGLMAVHPEILFQIQKCRPGTYNAIRVVSNRIPKADVQYFPARVFRTIRSITVTSAGRNHHQLSSGNDFLEQPFWLTLIKDAFWALRSLFIFLLEQPSQLKYIEWPSFQSTLKTASLTLVLVALLIVALASVDSALCYLLTYLLRKTP